MKIAMFALFLSLFSACSTTPKSQTTANATKVKPIFLWQLTDPRQESAPPLYLYGTMHLTDRDSAYLDRAVVQALGKVTALSLELHPDESSSPSLKNEVLKVGMLPDGSELKDLISAENYQKLGLALDKLKVSETVRTGIYRMRPWLISTTLAVMSMNAIGGELQYGSEAQLIALAKDKNKPIAGIETAASQLKVLASGDSASQEYQLSEALNDILGEEGDSEAMGIRKVYSDGDLAGLEKIAKDIASDSKSQGFYKAFLADRNKAMADKIKALIEEKKSSLVAVGALHYAGPGSIIELLKKDGYKVKRVKPMGRVTQIFAAKASAPLALDAEGWSKARTEIFSVKFKGPYKESELSEPASGKSPGTRTRVYQMDSAESLMSASLLELPAELGENIASVPPEQREIILKGMAQAAIAPFGKATKVRQLNFPVPGSQLYEFAGEKIGGKLMIFFHQKRVAYLLTGNPVARRRDPGLLADEMKFFKSLRLLQPPAKGGAALPTSAPSPAPAALREATP